MKHFRIVLEAPHMPVVTHAHNVHLAEDRKSVALVDDRAQTTGVLNFAVAVRRVTEHCPMTGRLLAVQEWA